MKIKIVFLSLFLFIVFNTLTYKFIEENKDVQINLEFENSISKLENHYKIFLHQQEMLSHKIYENLIEDDRISSTLTMMNNSVGDKKERLRNYLYQVLEYRFDFLKKEGVSELHFITPENISILRMNKKDSFGDDLSNIREDIKTVNQTKKSFKGFHHGRFSHGFRYIYPIFNENKNHIATLDITYSSESLQYHLTNISNIHTHFLIASEFFNEDFKRTEEFAQKYSISAENPASLLAITPKHTKQKCVIDNHNKPNSSSK